MALWRSISTSGIEIKFLVKRNGVLVTGITSGSFNITVVDPDDSASTALTVSQTTQLPGMYKFTIPSLFFTTNGVGHYGIRIGIHKPSPASVDDEILESLEINQNDIDMVATSIGTVNTNVNAVAVDINLLISAIIAADLVAAVGSTSTVIRTNATQASGFYDGLQVVIINSSGAVARKINGFVNANGEITVDTALPFTPTAGDQIIILGRIASAAAAVDYNAAATAVWAKSILTPVGGSYGELTNLIGDRTSIIPALI